LVGNHGNIGKLAGGHVHVDFEEASINAFRAVFPEATVHGCHFHYQQALIHHVKKKGLQAVYEQSQASDFHLPQYRCVKKWIRNLGALAFLPSAEIIPAYQRLLAVPPVTNNPVVDANLLRFRDYFQKEWMTDRKVEVLSNYKHSGPRTTNHAEGINNAFRIKFEKLRPRLSVFLVSYQEIHHATQARIRQLLSGAAPQPRSEDMVRKDAEILRYRNEFYDFWKYMVELSPPNFDELFYAGVMEYLQICSRF
jgi:hypothetical protein